MEEPIGQNNQLTEPSILAIKEDDEARMTPNEVMTKLQIPNEGELKKRIHKFYQERKKLRKILDSF